MMVHGFELVREQVIPEIASTAKLYRHARTRAQLLSVESADENKVFAISFVTLPEESTGVAHILEHSVLCGSKTYPVKEPFKELTKGSLKTFLNAFTSSDRTTYPVASQNRRDFYNLIGVYLDAVFNPLLAPETLLTQGWHYEADRENGALAYKGVVYNEMKGVYSSPDSLVGRYSRASVFPDNLYRLDSGGDPAVIPDLTYASFRAFYDRYYHPTNAYIYFYGDDNSDERLRIVDDYLSVYGAAEPVPTIPIQQSQPGTRYFEFGFDAGETGGIPTRRSLVTLNWLMNDVLQFETTMALEILSHILIGTQASPLRKELVDSRLGESVIGGYSSDLRQGYFSVGLKGIEAGDADRVEALILSTLERLQREGIDPGTIAASLNTIEFGLREFNTGGFPRGLALVLGVLPIWQYGGDPIEAISFLGRLERIKKAAGADPRYFESLVQAYLLDNSHRARVLLHPDPAARERSEVAERARLESARRAMSPQQLAEVPETARRLREMQEAPDTPEALATIPTLRLEDLDREIKRIPAEMLDVGGQEIMFHDLFTNGILYLDVGFNLRVLPRRLIPYAGLFGRLLTSMGTQTEDFVHLQQRIGQRTGGISRMSFTGDSVERVPVAWLWLRGKATVARTGDLVAILRDILLSVKLDDRERLRQIILEEKARLEAGLVPAGNAFVHGRLGSKLTASGWIGEMMGGIDYLRFLRRLVERLDSSWPAILSDLQEVHRRLIAREGMLSNVTLDAENFAAIQPAIQEFVAAFPEVRARRQRWTAPRSGGPEGLTIPSQVNFVGKGGNLYDQGYRLHGAALVANRLLGANWIWNKVRVQGGAYGGSCRFDHLSGLYAFLSYRDPNLLDTLEVYDASPAFLRSLEPSRDDLVKAIIGVIGDMDFPLLPDAKGFTSLTRHLVGLSDVRRQRLRDEVLATTRDDFEPFISALERAVEEGLVVVMGSEQALQRAGAALPGTMERVKLL